MVITGTTVAIMYGGWVVLSSASNAMDPKDKTLYGWVLRFLRLLTNSAVPLLEKELHISLPTQVGAEVTVETATATSTSVSSTQTK